MPVYDWSFPRKKSNLEKFYKIDVISMTDQDSFAAPAGIPPDQPKHGTLRKIKSLNDLLDNEVDIHSSVSKSGSGEISKKLAQPEQLVASTAEAADQNGSIEQWSDQLSRRGAKKPTSQFIVSGFSTLSRRAGGGV